MDDMSHRFVEECRSCLDRFFKAYPDAGLQTRAYKARRLLRASEKPLKGKPEGWAAGIIYFVATDGHVPCGVPGVLNAEFEELLNVSMKTAQYRAARVKELVMY